jgi:hypothetical protein
MDKYSEIYKEENKITVKFKTVSKKIIEINVEK